MLIAVKKKKIRRIPKLFEDVLPRQPPPLGPFRGRRATQKVDQTTSRPTLLWSFEKFTVLTEKSFSRRKYQVFINENVDLRRVNDEFVIPTPKRHTQTEKFSSHLVA